MSKRRYTKTQQLLLVIEGMIVSEMSDGEVETEHEWTIIVVFYNHQCIR